MKILYTILFTGILYPSVGWSQGNTGGISTNGVVPAAVAPTGNCGQGSPGRLVTSTGVIWTCQNITAGIGTWTAVSGGGGSCSSLSGDVTGACSSNTVVAVNGGSLPASQTCVGTNSSGQIVTGTCSTSSAYGNASLTPGTLNDGTLTAIGTISVSGALTGSSASAYPNPALPAGCFALAQVTGSGVVTVSILNLSGAPQTIASTAFTVGVGVTSISAPTSGTVSSGTTGQFAYYNSAGTTVAGRTLVAGDIPALNYQVPITFNNSASTNGLTIGLSYSAPNLTPTISGLGTTNFASTAVNEVCTITAGVYGCGYQVNGLNALWQDGNSNTVVGVSNFPTTITNASASNNTAVGSGALTLNTTGGYNTVVGSTSGRGNTTGSYNSCLGYDCMYGGTGQGNSALGATAMQGSTGSFNTGVGYSALSLASANNNSAVGSAALASDTSGSGNSAVGQNSLAYNLSGSNNAALGAAAGAGNYSGSSNVYVGLSAGIGTSAIPASQTGTSNSTTTVTFANTTGLVVGYNFFGPGVPAGTTISTVNTNTSVVLSAATTTGGSNKYFAVSNGNVSGSNNTFVGAQSGPSSAVQQTYETVIGSGATAACSNCVSVGRQGTTANSSDVMILKGLFTVSSGTGNPALPTGSGYAQACAWVADASTTPTYLGTATGGGSTKALTCTADGTTWLYH